MIIMYDVKNNSLLIKKIQKNYKINIIIEYTVYSMMNFILSLVVLTSISFQQCWSMVSNAMPSKEIVVDKESFDSSANMIGN